MPLILAVQPDKKEAAKVVAIARGSLLADIVVTDSAEEALASLATTVPDLVLISQLLSPKDDQAITDKLRQLDSAGVSVPTLVIPILGSPGRRLPLKQHGLLGRLRKTRGSVAAPDGCDPDVFAAQIAEYLGRASAEREAALRDAAADLEPVAAAPARVVEEEAHALPAPVVPGVERSEWAEWDASADQDVMNGGTASAQPMADTSTRDAAGAWRAVREPLAAAEPLAFEAPADDDRFKGQEETAQSPEEWEEIDLDLIDAGRPLRFTAATIDLDAFLREFEASDPGPRVAVSSTIVRDTLRSLEKPEAPRWGRCAWPRLEGETVADLQLEGDFEVGGDPALAEFAVALKRLPDEASQAPESLAASEAHDGPWTPLPEYPWPRMEHPTPASSAPSSARSKAPQDEWGFFNPDQCGIPAVMKRVSLIEAQEPRR